MNLKDPIGIIGRWVKVLQSIPADNFFATSRNHLIAKVSSSYYHAEYQLVFIGATRWKFVKSDLLTYQPFERGNRTILTTPNQIILLTPIEADYYELESALNDHN